MFNEEENIEYAVHFAEAVLADITSDYEILIVNDASTDRSAEIAEALAGSNPCVKVFHHARNLKLGGALRTGFSNATKELVFYCDSDLPVDLTELNRAVRIMEFSITEELFDPLLSPIRAKVSLTLRVLSINDLVPGSRGAELYLAYQAQKEGLARQFLYGTAQDLGVTL